MPPISEEEKLRRRQSNEDVLGTHAMEGLVPDSATLSLLSRFEEGDISREQLSVAIDQHVENLLAARRGLAGAA